MKNTLVLCIFMGFCCLKAAPGKEEQVVDLSLFMHKLSPVYEDYEMYDCPYFRKSEKLTIASPNINVKEQVTKNTSKWVDMALKYDILKDISIKDNLIFLSGINGKDEGVYYKCTIQKLGMSLSQKLKAPLLIEIINSRYLTIFFKGNNLNKYSANELFGMFVDYNKLYFKNRSSYEVIDLHQLNENESIGKIKVTSSLSG